MGDYSKTLNILEKGIASPDLFLEPQKEYALHFKRLAKKLYRSSLKLHSDSDLSITVLPKLLIDGFDEEQIWQQLELKIGPSLKLYKKEIKELNPDTIANNFLENKSKTGVLSTLESSEDEDDNGKEYVFDDDSSGDDSSVPDVENDKLKKTSKLFKSRKQYQKHQIDDQFFSFAQLEDVLKIQDIEDQKLANREIPSGDDDSDEIDYGASSSDEDDKSARDLMYKDFFSPPGSANEDEESSDDDDAENEKMEYDTRDYNPEEDEHNSSEPESHVSKEKKELFNFENSEDENDQQSRQEQKTAFEKQQEKERKQIHEMEENLLQPKPWQLTGEVAASNRPENSLMHQSTTFDANATRNLELTEDLTAKIENIIRMTITNKAWNDVERKVKQTENNTSTFKRQEPLEQTKSKKSLAEIYEDDYLKQKYKPEEQEEDPRHAEIQKLMDALTPELYALFSHIPKPPVPEIKVVNNMPAIAVEEVNPIGLSDAALLAPEEIKKKQKGDVKAAAEKTATDKKRERRKKKLHQKFRQKRTDEKLKILSATNPVLAEKFEKTLALKKLKQNKNTIVVNADNSKKIKSSKDFFSRLQETVHSKRPVKLKKK